MQKLINSEVEMNTKRYFVLIILIACLAACAPSSNQTPTQTATPKASADHPTPAPSITPSPYPTPDLSQRPLIWFAPLPPLSVTAGRPFTGAEDFMDLFETDAPWTQAAKQIQVFKLYGEWVGTDPWNLHASDAELKQVIADLNRRGIALAMEAGPLNATSSCGEGIEGFGGGVSIGIRDARRIKAAGGRLTFIALDEPFAFASLYQGANACQWTPEQVAQKVGEYIQGVKTVFPDLLVGDTEPLWQGIDVADYQGWLTTFKEVNGYDLAFFHLDVDFSRSDWPQAALQLEGFARERGIDFGLIYFGSWNAQTDEEWLAAAGERVKAYELAAGGQPDHVLFQSWHDHPDQTLPETEDYTFTWFINAYLSDKTSLGVRSQGPGANLAYSKPVRASSSGQFPAERAVDGDLETAWGAGNFAPQWIEIDLGEPCSISEIKLLTGQSPAGMTVHRILVKGPDPGDDFLEAHSFSESTRDVQWLNVSFPEALRDIRYVRIETTSSPSWVAWREVQVIGGE